MKKLLVLFAVALLGLTGCSSKPKENSGTSSLTATEGKFTVGMECNYAPFNWTQLEANETAVKLNEVDYCDGYDVVIAQRIADELGLELVIKKLNWEGLEPGVNNGEIDAIIAGMTKTPERDENADFSDPYYESDMVLIVRKDDPLATSTSIQDFEGKKVLGQINTLYDTVIDQIPNVIHATPLGSYPIMVVSLQNSEVDALTAELPVARGVVASNPNLSIVRFGIDKGFVADTSVSVAVKNGNTALLDKIQTILAGITKDERDTIMTDATGRQPSNAE